VVRGEIIQVGAQRAGGGLATYWLPGTVPDELKDNIKQPKKTVYEKKKKKQPAVLPQIQEHKTRDLYPGGAKFAINGSVYVQLKSGDLVELKSGAILQAVDLPSGERRPVVKVSVELLETMVI